MNDARREQLRAAQARYRTTEKGRAAAKRYRASAKGREAEERYQNSEKGLVVRERKTRTRTESGRGAHSQMRYANRLAEQRDAAILEGLRHS